MYQIMKCKSGQYGLTGGAGKDEVRVEDLFVSYRTIKKFTDILNEKEVSPCQLGDIIEDVLGDFDFLDRLLHSEEPS